MTWANLWLLLACTVTVLALLFVILLLWNVFFPSHPARKTYSSGALLPSTRYPDIRVPASVLLLRIFPVQVKVTLSPRTVASADSPMEVRFLSPDEAVTLDAVIFADDIEVIDDAVKQLNVPFWSDSEPTLFQLRATSTGRKEVRVEFFQKDRYVGGGSVLTQVIDDDSNGPFEDEGNFSGYVSIDPTNGTAPDVQLFVTECEGQEHIRRFKFVVHAPTVGLKYWGLSDELHIRGHPVGAIEQSLLEINSMSYGEYGAEAYREAANIGSYLYDELFPEELKLIWEDRIRGKIRTIMIISDEPWIPWEIIKPSYRNEVGEIVEDGFLCEDYVVTRWKRGYPPTSRIRILKGAIIADTQTLYHAEQEAELLRTRYQFEVVEPTLFAVRSLLKRPSYQLIHFACHGRFKHGQFQQSTLMLDDGELKLRDISGEYKNFGRCSPFVFVNSCARSRDDFAIVSVGGWAQRFIDAKVGAFLGTSWEVDDELCYEFARIFYEALADGFTLGEAVFHARHHLPKSNTTWLAYTLYADPYAKVVVSAVGERNERVGEGNTPPDKGI